MDQLNGFIDTIVFSSEETGFTVAKLKTPKQSDLITVVGSMPEINPGETLHCQGVWKHHARHGRQFEVQSYQLTAPVDILGIQKYLEFFHPAHICMYDSHDGFIFLIFFMFAL